MLQIKEGKSKMPGYIPDSDKVTKKKLGYFLGEKKNQTKIINQAKQNPKKYLFKGNSIQQKTYSEIKEI